MKKIVHFGRILLLAVAVSSPSIAEARSLDELQQSLREGNLVLLFGKTGVTELVTRGSINADLAQALEYDPPTGAIDDIYGELSDGHWEVLLKLSQVGAKYTILSDSRVLVFPSNRRWEDILQSSAHLIIPPGGFPEHGSLSYPASFYIKRIAELEDLLDKFRSVDIDAVCGSR